MKQLKVIASVFMALLLLCGALSAQAVGSRIMGVVTTSDGTPLPGVTVKATNPKMVGESVAVTDQNGTYRFLALSPGVFRLTYTLDGFQTLVREGINLAVEQTLNINVSLELGQISESIVVRGAPLIDVRSTAKGMTMTKEIFQALPKGRNFDSLITAIPGVSTEPMLGGTSVDGATGLENVYYVDGTDTTNIVTGASGQAVSFDFVDEVQVKTSGYQAEFGGSLGGVINVVTRSGGNVFRGDIIGYYSGSPLRAKYADSLFLNLQNSKEAKYYSYDEYFGKRDDFRIEGGINLGGFIIKDKIWFFGSFMPIYENITRSTTYLTGVTKDWKRIEQAMNWQVKLTAQPLNNLRLSTSVVNNFTKHQGDLSTIIGNPNPAISYDDFGFSFPRISGNFTADLTVGNNLMVGFRAGFFRTDRTNQLVQPPDEPCFQFLTEAPGGYYQTSNIGLLDIPTAYQRQTGYMNYARANASVSKKRLDEKMSMGVDFSYFLNFGGEHSWKAGIQFVRQGQDYDNTAKAPILFFAWNRDFIAYGTNYGRGTYGYYGVRNNDVAGPFGDFYKAYSNRWALYIQDSWTISNRLTLNFGVRSESEYIPSYATGNPEFEALRPIEWGFGDKIAPRFGFIWDVKGNADLKIFGSAGIFYDVMKLSMAAGSYGGFKWRSAYYALDTYEWDKIGVNGYFPGRLLHPNKTIDFRAPSFDTTDPNMKPMSQLEIALGMEKKIAENISLSARLVNKKLLWAIEDIGVLTDHGEEYYTTNPGGEFIKNAWAEAKALGLIPQGAPDIPKAKRQYWGINLSLDKRFSDKWMGGISYTWSSLRGNYSGLASGDEFGRTDPNVARYFDLWYLAFDKSMNQIDGPMPGDRPHYVKLYGSYVLPFGMTLGAVINAMSGIPVSTEYAMDVQGYLPYNRGDLGRTPFFWFANFYAEYNLKLGKNNLNINLNVDNLFNTSTAQRIYQIYNQGAVALTDDQILAGNWNIDDYKPVLDPRFMKEMWKYGDGFRGTPLTARLGLKFSF